MTASTLRVLLVADYPDDPKLGSTKVAHKLRDELRAAGHQCDALFAGAIGAAPAGRQVRQLVAPWMASRAVRRAFESVTYDVVDAASAEGLWVAAAKKAGRYARTAVICRSNGLEHLNYRRMLDDSGARLAPKPWTRRIWYPASRLSQVAAAARLADRMLVLNETDRRFAVSSGWQPETRVDVVPHGVSERFLEAADGPSRGGAGVLFCGTWDLVKGTSYLCEAFDELARTGCPVPLTVLGPGVPADRVLSCFSHAARSHVTVIDRVPEEQVMAEYRRHDLLVMPSTYEGFGLVALEAMSQGLPIIATPVGCVAGLVRHEENGIVVPPRDAHALARAVRELLSSPADRARLGAAAARSVAHMTWRRTAEQTLLAYDRALAQGRS